MERRQEPADAGGHSVEQSNVGRVGETDVGVENFRERHLLGSKTWTALDLVVQHPPQWHDENKEFLYRLHTPENKEYDELNYFGIVTYRRWTSDGVVFPENLRKTQLSVSVIDNAFDYEESTDETKHWYMNFAHFILFTAYSGSLFAQDEMQVAEIPALGSIREALRHEIRSEIAPLAPRTRSMDSLPTPVTISGIQRRVAVATDKNAAAGRPQGLYGNIFSRVPTAVIKRAATVIKPPTLVNIIAMEAPSGGHGVYQRRIIDDVFLSCYTGYMAIRADSSQPKVILHTGHWGCGAYGGNRELMALLQIAAAHLAGLHKIVYHTFGSNDSVYKAMEVLDGLLVNEISLKDFLDAVESKGYKWGVGDGN